MHAMPATQQPTQGAYVGSGTKLNIVSSQESSDTTISISIAPEAESGEEREDGEEFSLPSGDPLATAVSALPAPPPGHGHGKGRREVLLSLRPFLSERRCASIDRVLRALELYEVIEEGRR